MYTEEEEDIADRLVWTESHRKDLDLDWTGQDKSQMEHTHKLLYLFRGWIAFVAFMDFGTAFRAFIERRSFLGDTSTSMFVEGK